MLENRDGRNDNGLRSKVHEPEFAPSEKTHQDSAASRNRPSDPMFVPVDALRIPEQGLVDVFSVIGWATGHLVTEENKVLKELRGCVRDVEGREPASSHETMLISEAVPNRS